MAEVPEVREVASGLRFPEGPVARPDGSVILVEIERGTVSRVKADGTVEVVADVGGAPNGAAMGPDGACYVVNNGGVRWGGGGGPRVPPGLAPRADEPGHFPGGGGERGGPDGGAPK